MSRFREALLDAIDARDELVTRLADDGAAHARRSVAGIVVAAAVHRPTSMTSAPPRSAEALRRVREALAMASLHTEAHAIEHTVRVRQAGPGPDLGPVTRAHLEAHRAMRRG